MTREQIADLLGFPYDKIEMMCEDADGLEKILAYAVACGIQHGYSRAVADTNDMMKGHHETLDAVLSSKGAQ